jgi:SAM-dependent methyltransferase
MITLDKLRDDWEHLAERDALWAILTDSKKAGRKWEITEFMATGESEISTVINYLAWIGCLPDCEGMALDFGCGVGRLTQAIAQRFASCVGVDISKQMISQAEALNRFTHCGYVASSDPRLPFADNSFSFIYSNIVLQHVPRHISELYLRDFVRVLAPGGVLVFGVQDSDSSGFLVSLLMRTRQILRIRSRVKAALGLSAGNMQMHCLPERAVRSALGPAKIVDIQYTNTAASDFNGKLVYSERAPAGGCVGKQYCVVKQPWSFDRAQTRKPDAQPAGGLASANDGK